MRLRNRSSLLLHCQSHPLRVKAPRDPTIVRREGLVPVVKLPLQVWRRAQPAVVVRPRLALPRRWKERPVT